MSSVEQQSGGDYATPTMDFRYVKRASSSEPTLQQRWVVFASGPDGTGQTVDRLVWRDVPVVEESAEW